MRHKLQPLDRTFMGSLKTHYSEHIRQWIIHQEMRLGPYDIAEIFGKAYLECTTSSTDVNVSRTSHQTTLLLLQFNFPLVSQSLTRKMLHVSSVGGMSNVRYVGSQGLFRNRKRLRMLK
ncbi:hypothetical protein PR048_002954, partial [Dryococelus australis]